MSHFDPENAECLLFAYVQGALSVMGHDLKLRAEKFRIDVEEGTHAIEATFDPESVKVVCAMKQGEENRGALSERDKRKIESNIRKDVLHPDRHHEIRFQSKNVEPRDGSYRVQGDLTLHGRTRSIAFDVREATGRFELHVTLQQPDFGIKPYSAPLGVLKIKPEVTVEIRTK